MSIKIKSDQLSKGALYRRMMKYWMKLSTKHPSDTHNNFKNSHLKSIILRVKIFFCIIGIKIKIFCNQNYPGLKKFNDFRFDMCLVRLDGQKLNILGKENSAMYSK